jgi:thiamine-monophosphate kinase
VQGARSAPLYIMKEVRPSPASSFSLALPFPNAQHLNVLTATAYERLCLIFLAERFINNKSRLARACIDHGTGLPRLARAAYNPPVNTVGELGEFPLIDRIASAIERSSLPTPVAGGFHLVLGIGDDAAGWSLERGVQVTTTDTAVEGVHFKRQNTPWSDVGWRVWAANVSDIISMGGKPLVGVVTIGMPASLEVTAIDDLYLGLIEACHAYGTLIAGGDIVSSRDVFISVALTGVCESGLLRRDAASIGDLVGVSGPLGGSAGGLRLLQCGLASNEALISAHRRPQPRISTGLALLEAGVTGAMDVSDGLIADLAKLCRASGVAATTDSRLVPVAHSLHESFSEEESLRYALGGGEDYEVLFTGPRESVERAIASIDGASIIGEIVAGPPGLVTVLGADGNELEITEMGWEHLS